MDGSSPPRWAIVGSTYHAAVVDRLVASARDCLLQKGVPETSLDVLRVAGAFELPQAVSALLAAGTAHRGVVALGCVIRGETPHFDYVCSEASRGLLEAAMRSGVALGFGLLTCDTMQQAVDRAGGPKGDKGWEAADAAWGLADVLDAARRLGPR